MGTIYRNGKVNTIIKNGKIYGYASGGGGTEILKGTTDPTSAQGNNGEIYLKYGNYTYTSFMNDTIIVRENEDDATDKKLFFVELTKTADDILITDTDLLNYLSDITSGLKKATYSYSDVNNTRNGNIGFHYSGGNIYLRSWTINWTQTMAGTFYGIIDLNEPPNSGSVSSGQTNPYFEPNINASTPIIKSYAKVNNTWQNLIGSDIDDVGNASETATPIDMSDITKVAVTSSMSYVSFDNIIVSAWDGNDQIAANGYITTPIDVTNINKLYYELETKNCWGNGSQALQDRWKVMIGLMQTPITSAVEVPFDQAGFSAGEDFAYSNTNYGTEEIDVSNLTGNYYFTFVTHGWNAMISNLRYE